jgi:3',5'-cyclic AMP phosphodiesterase CpdA
MVQAATQGGATLIWYTTQPMDSGACRVSISTHAGERTYAAESVGRRQRVRIDGLAPGQAYPYRIHTSRRTLAEATLRTNKPVDQPFSFLVFGDSGSAARSQYLLAVQMRAPRLQPDFILHVGDLVYSDGTRQRYKDRFFLPYRHLLAEIGFWPTCGNHELVGPDERPPYLDVFELPKNGPPGRPVGREYWFDYGAARFAVVDSNKCSDEATLREQVAPWLRAVLGGSSATWKFVALHHPPYTAGTRHAPDERVQRALVPVFEKLGVDIVFAGHNHLYERILPLRDGQVTTPDEGVVYVVTGAGGARLYELPSAQEYPPYLAAAENRRHSFTHVRIDGRRLRLEQIDIDGAMIDEWTRIKPAVTQLPDDRATQSGEQT